MKIIKAAGTWLPCLIVFFIALAAVDQALVGKPTWELLLIYGAGFISLWFGAAALIQMARYSRRRFPSFLILSFIYQKVALALVFGAVFGILVNAYLPRLPHVPEIIVYPLLAGSVSVLAVVNFALWFGRKRGWLEASTDPLPFRNALRRLRRRFKS